MAHLSEMATRYKPYEAKYNPALLEAILQHESTVKWLSCCYEKQPFHLIPVDRMSTEFSSIRSMLDRGIVKRIDRVQNPYLLGQYLLKKEKMLQDYSSVYEKKYFHGTKKSRIDRICSNNFDWRLSGTSRGHKFGQGVSFARDFSYAQHYTKGDNVVICSLVLQTHSQLGSYSTIIPSPGKDTTQNIQGTVFVKYEDNDFYPMYILHY